MIGEAMTDEKMKNLFGRDWTGLSRRDGNALRRKMKELGRPLPRSTHERVRLFYELVKGEDPPAHLIAATRRPAGEPDGTPGALDLCRQYGLDPWAIRKSGAGGKLVEADVKAHLAAILPAIQEEKAATDRPAMKALKVRGRKAKAEAPPEPPPETTTPDAPEGEETGEDADDEKLFD